MEIVNRIFYIDVGNISPNDIPNYMDSVKTALTEKDGKIAELKKNGVWEDLFIPVRRNDHLGLLEKIYGFFFGNPKTTVKILKVKVKVKV